MSTDRYPTCLRNAAKMIVPMIKCAPASLIKRISREHRTRKVLEHVLLFTDMLPVNRSFFILFFEQMCYIFLRTAYDGPFCAGNNQRLA